MPVITEAPKLARPSLKDRFIAKTQRVISRIPWNGRGKETNNFQDPNSKAKKELQREKLEKKKQRQSESKEERW